MSIEDLIKHPVSLHIAGVLAVPAVGCFGATAAAPARPSAVATGSVDCLGCTNVQRTSSLADPLSPQYNMHAPYLGRTRFAALAPHIGEADRCTFDNTNLPYHEPGAKSFEARLPFLPRKRTQMY